MKKFSLNNSVSFADINSAIETDGVVMIEDFLNEAGCDAISKLLDGSQKINSNELSFVHFHDSRFFSNALGASKDAFDLVTKSEALEIARNYLGEDIRLKCHRAYQIAGSFKFPWHTDNKFDNDKNNFYGLVIIVYLVDTFSGGTEFVLGSHKFSGDYGGNNFFEKYIDQNFSEKIFKTSGRKGVAVISDTRTIHRGGYSLVNSNPRKSFWFQIEKNLDCAERLLINPEFLPERPADSLLKYLGFGRTAGLTVHPFTTNDDKVLSVNFRISEFLRYGFLLIKIPTYWIKSILSMDLKIKIKSFFLNRKENDWN